MTLSIIQKNLQKLIREHNLTIAVVERLAGLKKNNLYNIIRGTTKQPSIHVLKAVAEVFKITVNDLYSNDDLVESPYNEMLKLLNEICNMVIKEIMISQYNLTHSEITKIISEVYEWSTYNSMKVADYNYIKWILKQKSLANSTIIA
jgi:transcriptional regulator with XRE-family HTH domain